MTFSSHNLLTELQFLIDVKTLFLHNILRMNFKFDQIAYAYIDNDKI